MKEVSLLLVGLSSFLLCVAVKMSNNLPDFIFTTWNMHKPVEKHEETLRTAFSL